MEQTTAHPAPPPPSNYNSSVATTTLVQGKLLGKGISSNKPTVRVGREKVYKDQQYLTVGS